MGLEHDLAELSTAYQSCLSVNSEMRDRIQQLETLLNQYHELIDDYLENNFFHAFPADMAVLQQCAKESLGKM